MENQQKEGIYYQLRELYAPVMKATEVIVHGNHSKAWYQGVQIRYTPS
jgi:hypothetical protein